MKPRNIFILTAAMSAAALALGCNECEQIAQTNQDLTTAQTLLKQGVTQADAWGGACSALVQLADAFRSDADYVRGIADDAYQGIPADCQETGYLDYCSGGWLRTPWDDIFAGVDAEDFAHSGGGGGGGGGHGGGGGGGGGGGWHGGHGGGGGPWGPHPYPGPIYPGPHHPYPPYFPYHPYWGWTYEPRICETVPVCLRYAPGDTHPEYQHVMALAYELDQAAGGIETACQRYYEGAPKADIDKFAQETLDRLNAKAIPDVASIYAGLSCLRSGD